MAKGRSKRVTSPSATGGDPQLRLFERGVQALHQGKWEAAHKLFARVRRETDQRDLADRARRYIEICRQRLEAAGTDGSGEDPFLRAVFERNRGNFEAALALCSRGGRQGKDDRFAYLAAAVSCLTGDLEKGAKLLARAIELNAKNRVHAFHDADFAELRRSPEHSGLFR